MNLSKPQRDNLVFTAVLVVVYALDLWLTMELRTVAGGISTLWTTNAIIIAGLILLPRAYGIPMAALCWTLQVLITLKFNPDLIAGLLFTAPGIPEAILVVWLAHRFNATRLTSPDRVARLFFLAIMPGVIISTLMLAVILPLRVPVSFMDVVVQRLPAKLLGVSLVLPGLLLIARTRTVLPERKTVEASIHFLTIAGLSFLPFSGVSVPLFFLLFPMVTVTGFRLGPRAVTVAVAIMAAIMFPLGVLGGPQLFNPTWTVGTRILMLQLYVAMVFITGLTAALAVSHQERLRRLFAKRSEAAMRARDRAMAASIAKTEFLATMSHEIRTPLNSILGFAQVLERRDDLPADARGQVGMIESAGGSLLTVVNDILDFSKVEAGRVALDPKPANLATICREAIAIVANNAAKKGLALNFSAGEADAGAHICDDHRLRQVLLNYLNNAIKFTDKGAVTLTLSVTPEGDRDRVRFSVDDTGVGIAAEARDRLFERFSQVDSSISRTYGGTGLGLAICKGLTELMGGRVGVESEPGQGSTFWAELVLDRAETTLVAGEEEAAEGVTAHVLLVDDHPMNRELGATILGLIGSTCDVARDGNEAIEAARSGKYDVILMDVHMPVVDGLAATRAIRALPGPAGMVPVIAMSADVMPEQLAQCTAAGMVDSVGKPINIETLLACLNRWVGRDAEGRALAA